jgi:hypothetical protein
MLDACDKGCYSDRHLISLFAVFKPRHMLTEGFIICVVCCAATKRSHTGKRQRPRIAGLCWHRDVSV